LSNFKKKDSKELRELVKQAIETQLKELEGEGDKFDERFEESLI